jgi:hypothetical protein
MVKWLASEFARCREKDDGQSLSFLAEASLMLWLIVKGVNVQRWNERERARRAAV